MSVGVSLRGEEATLPPRCLARVFSRGAGVQCSRRAVRDDRAGAGGAGDDGGGPCFLPFCRQHAASLPHGRVDNVVMLPAEAARFEAFANRRARGQRVRWYSRIAMLAEAVRR